LSVERIVDAACRIVEREGVGGLSMRKLGAELHVDAMAVYHHVANKREILALVTGRVLGEMTPPDPAAGWQTRVRKWATSYWDLVVSHRDLTLEGLADPDVAIGGLGPTETLIEAITDSGIADDLIRPVAFIVVDAVHGSALGAGSTRCELDTHDSLRAAFEVGLDTIVAGIVARAAPVSGDGGS
jgi:AcrR family transcriptional regulator